MAFIPLLLCARPLGRVIWGHVAERQPKGLCAAPPFALTPGCIYYKVLNGEGLALGHMNPYDPVKGARAGQKGAYAQI